MKDKEKNLVVRASFPSWIGPGTTKSLSKKVCTREAVHKLIIAYGEDWAHASRRHLNEYSQELHSSMAVNRKKSAAIYC